jgi:hypothetical protein
MKNSDLEPEPHVFSIEYQRWRVSTEEVILGACLMDRCAFPTVMDLLIPRTFIGQTYSQNTEGFRLSHGNVWEAIQKTYLIQNVDLITVTRKLISTHPDLVEVAYAVSLLTDRVASTENLETHAILLIEARIREEVINLILSWMTESSNQQTADFQGLVKQFKNLDSDILIDIELGISFLNEHEYPDEAEELRCLIPMVASRIRHLKSRLYRQHIYEQYHLLKALNNE